MKLIKKFRKFSKVNELLKSESTKIDELLYSLKKALIDKDAFERIRRFITYNKIDAYTSLSELINLVKAEFADELSGFDISPEGVLLSESKKFNESLIRKENEKLKKFMSSLEKALKERKIFNKDKFHEIIQFVNFNKIDPHMSTSELIEWVKTKFSEQLKNINISQEGEVLLESTKKIIIFKHKRNPEIEITVSTQNGRIQNIDNKTGIRFPFSVGQSLSRNIEVWACNNNFLMDGKDTCPEKKVFGMRVSDIPQGHELRTIYPNKFR